MGHFRDATDAMPVFKYELETRYLDHFSDFRMKGAVPCEPFSHSFAGHLSSCYPQNINLNENEGFTS
jgi:hypothetical protein